MLHQRFIRIRTWQQPPLCDCISIWNSPKFPRICDPMFKIIANENRWFALKMRKSEIFGRLFRKEILEIFHRWKILNSTRYAHVNLFDRRIFWGEGFILNLLHLLFIILQIVDIMSSWMFLWLINSSETNGILFLWPTFNKPLIKILISNISTSFVSR